jgi:HEAT repeat protein
MCQILRAIGLSTTIVAFLTAVVPAADVGLLRQTLISGAPADRYAAADALADLGTAGGEAIPELLAALKSPDVDLRWRAARALGVVGDGQAVAGLKASTSDAEALVRAQAIFALGRLKPADKESLAAVTEHLSDADAQVRRAAVRALRMIDAPRQQLAPLIGKLLSDAEPAIAARALSSLTDGGVEVVPALVSALDQPQARYWACLALGEMGPQAQAAVPALIKVLSDERPEVRLQATIALGEIGPDAKPAVAALMKLLDDPIPSVRAAAVFALGHIGDPAAIAALENTEKSTEPVQRMLATWALAKLHPSDQQRLNKAIDSLVLALADKSREVAIMAAKALEDLRPGTDLLRPLIDKLIAGKPEAAERIMSAVAPLGASAVPQAIAALKDPQRRVRAMQVLARIGPESAPAVPGLVELLKSGEPATTTEALYTLGAIGPSAQGAVGAIVEQLRQRDPRVVQAAIIALGKIGPAAREAIPALGKLNQSDDELLRMTSVWAILKIGPPSDDLTKAALPILAAALQNNREFVRVEAATSLGELGRGAADALPALQAAANDSSPAVRSAVASAIGKIR